MVPVHRMKNLHVCKRLRENFIPPLPLTTIPRLFARPASAPGPALILRAFSQCIRIRHSSTRVLEEGGLQE
jgi:hypothetical protein